jgi:tetratricopeptide (TPR) repeat protein
MQQRLEPLFSTLVPLKRWADLETALWKVVESAQSLDDWQAIRQAFDAAKLTITATSSLAGIYACLLIATRDTAAIAHLTADLPPQAPPMLHLARGWMYNRQNQPTQALLHLEQAATNLTGRYKGIAYLFVGQALFALRQDWQGAFRHAATILTGRNLGLCLLEHGTCLDRLGRGLEARQMWLKAVPHLKQDAFYAAWLQYNLGISALRDLDVHAERYFLELQRLSKSHHQWFVQAWRGLAAVRRVLGEFDRAEFAYRVALEESLEPDQFADTSAGLSMTLRLAGQPYQALEVIQSALVSLSTPAPILVLHRAAAELKLGMYPQAKASLESLPPNLIADDVQRQKILLADICRHQQDFNTILTLLKDVNFDSLSAREELTHLPHLSQLLDALNVQIKPLEYEAERVVSVYALGGLRIFINQRGVSLTPRTGELLVLLLERGGSASREDLCSTLYMGQPHKRALSGLRTLLVELRQVLGWQDCYTREGAVIRLDTKVRWFYDVEEARTTKNVAGVFLEGVYRDWVQEIQQELALFSTPDLKNLN